MMRMGVRPVYRWKSFWLGMVVVCFLGWARWDVARHDTWAQSITRLGQHGMVRLDGVTFLYRGEGTFFAFNGVQQRPAEETAEELEERDLRGGNLSYVRIPDWMVWVGFAVVWGWWMLRRWRAMRRTLNIEHRTSNIEHRTSNIEL